jgi:mycothiol synthase
MLTIRPAVTDADYAAYRGVRAAVEPGQRIASVAEMRSFDRPGRHLVLAEVDGQLAGAGVADRSDSVGRASVAPRVLPEFRRRGIGSALLRHLCELAEPLGYPVVGVLADDAVAVAFAHHHGFKEVDRQVEQVRLIGDEPWPTLPDGVELVSVQDRPSLWEEAYDAIAVQGYADMAASREIVVSRKAWIENEMNEPAAAFIALRDGRIIGTASLLTDSDNPTLAEHGLTTVARDERGKGIAAALKRQTLAWAAANGVTRVYTWTQKNNEDMRRLNEHLGFTYATLSVTLEAPLPLPSRHVT